MILGTLMDNNKDWTWKLVILQDYIDVGFDNCYHTVAPRDINNWHYNCEQLKTTFFEWFIKNGPIIDNGFAKNLWPNRPPNVQNDVARKIPCIALAIRSYGNWTIEKFQFLDNGIDWNEAFAVTLWQLDSKIAT